MMRAIQFHIGVWLVESVNFERPSSGKLPMRTGRNFQNFSALTTVDIKRKQM